MTTKHSTAGYDVTDLSDLSAAARASVRATEDGRHARTTGHLGQYAVLPQVTRLNAANDSYGYTVTVLGPQIGHAVRCACNCKAGIHRPELDVPCRHAGAVIKRLEREGLAIWSNTLECAVYTENAVRRAIAALEADLGSYEAFKATVLAESVFG